MIRFLSLLLFFIALNTALGAQPIQAAKAELSAGFDEPHVLETKVIQCLNGNTLLLQFTKRDEIEVTVYNKLRKVVGNRVLSAKDWERFGDTDIQGIFEINGQVVIFLQQMAGRDHAVLFRIQLNAENGLMVANKKIGDFAGEEERPFLVEKDPATDNYAIAMVAGGVETTNRGVIKNYNGRHEVIDSAVLDLPETNGLRVFQLGLVVDGADNSSLALYANGIGRQDAPGSKLMIVSLSAHEYKVRTAASDLTQDFEKATAIVAQDGANGAVKVLIEGTEKDGTGRLLLITYTLSDHRLSSAKELSFEKIPVPADKKDKGKTPIYDGVPMAMTFNPDHTLSLGLETRGSMSFGGSNGGVPSYGGNSGFGGHTFYRIMVGNIGLLNLDQQDEPAEGAFLVNVNDIMLPYPINAINARRAGRIKLNIKSGSNCCVNNSLYSYDLIAANNARYVFFNAPVEGENAQSMATYNTICYKYSGGKVDKFSLFGEPNEQFANRFAFIGSGNYLAATNTYATIIVERIRKSKTAHLAWVVLP